MKKQLLFVGLFVLTFSSAFPQWNIGGGFFNRHDNSAGGLPLNQRRSWGFGDFSTNGAFPLSRVNINDFFCLGTPNFLPGQLFRTDGNAANLNAWTFFTGGTAGTVTEKFTLYTRPNSSEVNLQATDVIGELVFRTVDTTERFRIRDDRDQIFAFGNYPPYGINLFQPSYPAKFNINDRNKSILNTENEMLLRVWGRGINRGVDPNGILTNYTLAEIIQSANNTGDAGMLIQGSRAFGSSADVSFIDFGNNDITNGGDYVLSRVAGGLDTPPNDPTLERSVYRIYTNAGVDSVVNPNDTFGLIERFRIRSNGMTGIGNYNNSSGQGPGTLGYIDATLDIDGDMRIRTVLKNDTLDRVLVIDSTDRNRVYYRDISSFPTGGGSGTGGTGIGNYCSDTTQNPLTDHYEIPMNNFNYYFSNPAGTLNENENFVMIGANCGTPIIAKLEVHRDVTTNTQFNNIGSAFFNNDIAQSTSYTGFGFGAAGIASGENRTNAGVGGYASNARVNTGGYFRAETPYNAGLNINITNMGAQCFAGRGNENIGLQSTAFSTAFINRGGEFKADQATNSNIGIRASTGNTALSNIAGFFNVISPVSGMNIGLYSQVLPINSSTPPNPPVSGNYAAYLDGDVFVSGTIYYTTPPAPVSDQSIKTNIDTLSNALSLIDMLKPRSFNYDATAIPEMNFPPEKQYGFIAQDVELILPDLVGEQYSVTKFDTLGNIINTPQLIKNLNYNSFIAILTKGVQELNSENEELQNKLNEQDSINNALQDQINTLYSMITSCCSNNSNTENNSLQQNPNTTLDVTLTDNVPSIVLDQNVPNPFAEQTTITYTLTNGVQKAQMLFYNIEGKLIQAVELSNAAGQGQMNVFANDLSTGVYTYTLVVDGAIKGTKRMVKE